MKTEIEIEYAEIFSWQEKHAISSKITRHMKYQNINLHSAIGEMNSAISNRRIKRRKHL